MTELESLTLRVLRRDTGLTAQEKGHSLEGFALLLASYWEELVNDDFVDALNRDTSQYGETVGISLPRNLPRDVCFGLLVGYGGYLDFKNVGDLIQRAKGLLVLANNPFRYIPQPSRRTIDDFFTLRNYLAHRSHKSYRSYSRMMRVRYDYERVPNPRVFLHAVGGNAGECRFLYFLRLFRHVSETVRARAAF